MKNVMLVSALFFLATTAMGLERLETPRISPDEISLKAGPTEPGEGLNLIWLEALVYPKEVKSDRVISLGVKLTSKVDSVVATFDFSDDRIPLVSNDGLDWKTIYRLPDGAGAGLHIVRYVISSKNKNIQRTVDFFVKDSSLPQTEGAGISKGEVIGIEKWPLTVTSTCAALVGASSRLLYPGQKVTGISKIAWYKVIFEDGEEGWVPATMILEPISDYMTAGYNFYLQGKDQEAVRYYKSVLAIDPAFAKAYFWLAKVYLRNNDLNAAYKMIREASRIDDRDLEIKVLSNAIAQKFFDTAHLKYREGRYNEAIASFQKVVELKPTSTLSWIEMGQSYKAVGMMAEANNAWREAQRLDPENLDALTLLSGVKLDSAEFQPAAKTAGLKPTAVPAVVADDSLSLVKSSKTKKGTKIENAIRSVIALTKSLGTPIVEKGWEIKKAGENYVVRYLCEQGNGDLEIFEWQANVDAKTIVAKNENAQLLMDRW